MRCLDLPPHLIGLLIALSLVQSLVDAQHLLWLLATAEMMLFNLDIAGIAASGGSACTSGSNQGSHVLKGIGTDQERPAVRFSFSRFNTKEEIDFCVAKLTELIGANNN